MFILTNIQINSDFYLGIDIKKKYIEKTLKSLFFIHKKKKYPVFHSTFYVQLQEIFKNINLNKDELSSPPPNVILTKGFNELNPLRIKQNTKNLENNDIEFSTYIDKSTIDELDIF